MSVSMCFVVVIIAEITYIVFAFYMTQFVWVFVFYV